MSLQTSEATAPATLRGPAPSRLILFSASASPLVRGPLVAYAPENDAGASTGALTMEEATSLLTAGDAPEAEAEPEEVEAEEEPQDEEVEADDQPADEDEAPDDEPVSEDDPVEDEEETPADPVVDPPKFWSAEEKALFATAPPEVQKIIAARDAESSRQVSLAKEEAAAARKEASIIGQAVEAIDKQITRAREVFKGKWDGVDWAQWVRESPEEAIAAKFEFDAEQQELQKLEVAQKVTAEEEHRQFLKSEGQKLADLVPELVDPKEGRNRKAAVIQLLEEDGFTADDLKWMGARELRIAYEAQQYRKLKANAAKRPKPAPEPQPAKAKTGTARPTAAAPPRATVQHRQKREVIDRAFQSGRMDDAVAAVLAMERG